MLSTLRERNPTLNHGLAKPTEEKLRYPNVTPSRTGHVCQMC
jgi:hypothetical protein